MRYRFLILTICLFLTFSLSPAFAQKMPKALDSGELESKISQNQGKVVVVNFWTTTCPACQDEVEELKELRDKFDTKQLIILGVAMDRSKERIKDYAQKNQINYTIYQGSRDMIYKYDVRGVPKTFFYDLQGDEAKSKAGFIPLENLESNINKLLD